ncbi:ribonuclease P protein component [Roseibium porphyridii]|uniref:Ribonuclease P protein component n=1 Tax=Roseibium porphyridii TaxID=2866279 RepID=A0ABY8F436_9HYPH|nr:MULTISPECIES: ribonuclease P protein component [Stappiaceae]QFT34137.1 Ribonuclease P protein component [Labrenzia sp. THAF82]WFE89154.1 ribonuclease P protein component [Roseibium sp. KMA01]
MDTLKKRSEFLAVAKGGRLGRRAFVVQGLERKSNDAPRVGYTVTKKTGNSVARSRIKRRLRAAIAELDTKEIPQNADFVLVARSSALTLPFQNLVADLKSGLGQVLDPGTPRGRGKPRRGPKQAQTTSRRKQG